MATFTDLFNLALALKEKGIDIEELGLSTKKLMKKYIEKNFGFTSSLVDIDLHLKKAINATYKDLKERYSIKKI